MKRQKTVKFNIDLLMNYIDDENPDYGVLRLNFLSDGHNAHGIPITEEILKNCAKTILGKPIVAKYNTYTNDAEGHETDEVMVGYIPETAQIEFEDSDNGIFACVDGLISKLYASNVYELYKSNNQRAVSVEMNLLWSDENETSLEAFTIRGVTLLGLTYNPSCTLASSTMVRFSLEEANSCYEQYKSELSLIEFAERRKAKMEGKTYKVNTTELKETPWGEVDKVAMRNKIMEASNKATLVKKVYMLVEDGWQDAPSEHLKYPVMELVDDTFYYNRYGLASALAYAKQEGEDAVVAKIEKIYDKFELDSEDKEDKAKMSTEIKFAAVDLGDLWGAITDSLYKRLDYKFYIDGIYEETNQKFVIVKNGSGEYYRIDFSFTEEGMFMSDEMQRVGIEFTPTSDAVKFEVPAEYEKFTKFEDESDDDEPDDDNDDDDDDDKKEDGSENKKMSEEEMEAKIQELTQALSDKEEIIMGQETELADLREFKANVEEQTVKATVDETMSSVKKQLGAEQFNDLQEEGMACKMSELDGWKNKVKAVAFDAMPHDNSNNGLWKVGAPQQTQKQSGGLWD